MTSQNSDFTKILVCIDGSKHSERALLKAISLAKKYHSKLFILTVIEDSLIDFWNETVFAVGAKKPQTRLKKDSETWKHAKKLLEKSYKKIPSKIEFERKILSGDTVNEIIAFAKREKVDLILLGARGMGTFAKLLLGSISRKVSDHSPCSVLIVR